MMGGYLTEANLQPSQGRELCGSSADRQTPDNLASCDVLKSRLPGSIFVHSLSTVLLWSSGLKRPVPTPSNPRLGTQ